MKKWTSMVCLVLALVLCYAMVAQAEGLLAHLPGDGGVIVELVEPWDAEQLGKLLQEAYNGPNLKSVTVPTLSEALMMLTSGRADVFTTFYDSARYIASRNEGMTAIEELMPAKVRLCIVGALTQTDNMAKLNAAIEATRSDGTADSLWNEHVEAVIDGAQPVSVTLPVIEGADTIIVGVSGDCPPIDYTTPDGMPAGFNTAMLAELAQRAGLNIEIKQVDSGARFLAMSSGEIDFFFWQVNRDGFEEIDDGVSKENKEKLKEAMDFSDQFIISVPYYEASIGLLLMTAE